MADFYLWEKGRRNAPVVWRCSDGEGATSRFEDAQLFTAEQVADLMQRPHMARCKPVPEARARALDNAHREDQAAFQAALERWERDG